MQNSLPATDLEYAVLLPAVVAAVEAAGSRMSARFEARAGLSTVADIAAATRAGIEESLSVLRPLLETARPRAGWVGDELGDGPLPAGEWWVADPVEGAINYVHGIAEWGITAILVHDNEPVLTVVHSPLDMVTYAAARGYGAFENGVRQQASSRTELQTALVGTGQARPRESRESFELIARTLPAMMEACAVTRVSVPSTMQLTDVAAGRMDVFWQFSTVRSALLAGALLVSEAGGTVSDVRGKPWSSRSTDFLAAAPGLHKAAWHALTAAL